MGDIIKWFPPPPWEGLPLPRGDTDRCSRCGNEFPVEELFYEGVEPFVHSPKCRICMVKEAQEIYGEENVILPPDWTN